MIDILIYSVIISLIVTFIAVCLYYSHNYQQKQLEKSRKEFQIKISDPFDKSIRMYYNEILECESIDNLTEIRNKIFSDDTLIVKELGIERSIESDGIQYINIRPKTNINAIQFQTRVETLIGLLKIKHAILKKRIS